MVGAVDTYIVVALFPEYKFNYLILFREFRDEFCQGLLSFPTS